MADANYYLLGTTNLITINWLRHWTNRFDNNGNFKFINLPNPSWPQGYYRLLVP
jgi:hypothetical protein